MQRCLTYSKWSRSLQMRRGRERAGCHFPLILSQRRIACGSHGAMRHRSAAFTLRGAQPRRQKRGRSAPRWAPSPTNTLPSQQGTRATCAGVRRWADWITTQLSTQQRPAYGREGPAEKAPSSRGSRMLSAEQTERMG